MSRTYAELITLVRNWANRDVEVLSDSIVADCLRYAADKAYRKLRVAPLEHTLIYTEGLEAATTSSTNRFSSVTELALPVDLIEFIQIRGIDSCGRTTRMFNEKADLRTFNDIYAEKYSDLALWTRQGNCILLAPGIGNTGTNAGASGVGQEEGVEIHYYRRLPSLHARFDVSATNAGLGLNTIYTMDSELPTVMTPEVLPTGTLYRTTDTTADPSWSDTMTSTHSVSVMVYGNSVPNWMKDENERVVLMGALAEIFFYLQENDEAQKYGQLFAEEMLELNMEDQMRNASGGNIQMNFNGRGLI